MVVRLVRLPRFTFLLTRTDLGKEKKFIISTHNQVVNQSTDLDSLFLCFLWSSAFMFYGVNSLCYGLKKQCVVSH